METSIAALISTSAVRYGEKTALVVDGKCYSFADLDLKSSAVAAQLRERGVGEGSVVSIFGPNSADWIIAYYGILKAGCIVNPLNLMLTGPEAAFAISDCNAVVVFGTTDRLVPLGSTMQDSCPLLVSFTEGGEGVDSFDDWTRSTTTQIAADVQVDRLNQISTIAYTSGTTGKPKGAQLSHRAILCNVAMTATMHQRTSEDIVVSALPLSHVYGNVVMQSAIAYGMTLVLHATFNPEEILSSIERYRATLFEGVPTMYFYLLDFPSFDRYDLSSVTRCTVGGQTMPIAKMREIEKRFGAPLLELWGMTELGGLGTTHALLGEKRLGAIGVPLPSVQARIIPVDASARSLEAGEVGELAIKGPITMVGYLNRPEATDAAFDKDGFLRTGDLAYMDSEGFIFVVDRLKDMIITAGFKVYPAELEAVLYEHPAVAMAAVVGVPDPVKGELAKAFVVCGNDCCVTETELLDFCRTRLAAYKVPRIVSFVDDLPKTASGKILRRALRE